MKWLLTGMVLLAVLFGLLGGRMSEVSNAAVQESYSAIKLFLTIAGTMCFWSGIMRIAEKSGVTKALCRLFKPLGKLLFPEINPDGRAFQAISMNVTANLLGLGNAATPLGMEAMRSLEEERADGLVHDASNAMVMFVVLNTASLQLLPTTIAALRLQFGSQSPFDITQAVWLASIVSVVTGVSVVLLFSKMRQRTRQLHGLLPPAKEKRRSA